MILRLRLHLHICRCSRAVLVVRPLIIDDAGQGPHGANYVARAVEILARQVT